MQRICKYCGKEYSGDPGSSCCPDCAAAQRQTTLRERTCTVCGVRFTGGPSAHYCPDCRLERRRKTDREYRQRLAAGHVRRIGSPAICEVCGNPYTVMGGRQKYCPTCSPSAIRAKDNAKSREWNAAHVTAEQRRLERQAAAAPIPCAVCGRLFIPTTAALTCSASCAKTLHKQWLARWERENAAQRNDYRKKARLEAEAKMTPEQYAEYREKINTKARENYRKRKE